MSKGQKKQLQYYLDIFSKKYGFEKPELTLRILREVASGTRQVLISKSLKKADSTIHYYRERLVKKGLLDTRTSISDEGQKVLREWEDHLQGRTLPPWRHHGILLRFAVTTDKEVYRGLKSNRVNYMINENFTVHEEKEGIRKYKMGPILCRFHITIHQYSVTMWMGPIHSDSPEESASRFHRAVLVAGRKVEQKCKCSVFKNGKMKVQVIQHELAKVLHDVSRLHKRLKDGTILKAFNPVDHKLRVTFDRSQRKEGVVEAEFQLNEKAFWDGDFFDLWMNDLLDKKPRKLSVIDEEVISLMSLVKTLEKQVGSTRRAKHTRPVKRKRSSRRRKK